MNIQTIALNDIQTFFKPRPVDAHKGMFGRILVIGGDYGMPGAVRLAGEAALRTGAGLVTVFTRSAHVPVVVTARPELLCYGSTFSLRILKRLLAQATLVVMGSGLGQSLWSKRLFDTVMDSNLPKIIDADGLNWLARSSQTPKTSEWILTPHPGEAARLLGKRIDDIQNNRQAAVLELQNRYGGVIVLKGAGTLIATAGQELVQCTAGNPAMASAGMGDVLCGLIAGLVGQSLSLWEAAQAGVVMHATAADRVVARQGHRGLLASDLFAELMVM
ncbi:MAG: NAD(P)H-hydrate dehydratase [Gammaproteobacteria bacterium]